MDGASSHNFFTKSSAFKDQAIICLFAAKYVIKRKTEKVLVLSKIVPNFHAQIVAIIIWNCIPEKLAKHCYHQLSNILGRHGVHAPRKCEFNEEITCVCNGVDLQGASISLGCSYQGLVNGCKFKVSSKYSILFYSLDHILSEKSNY